MRIHTCIYKKKIKKNLISYTYNNIRVSKKNNLKKNGKKKHKCEVKIEEHRGYFMILTCVYRS